MCRVRNRFLRRSVLDFLFLGLGVWGDGLFSLAVLFFWGGCFAFSHLDFYAVSLAATLRDRVFSSGVY